MSGYVREINAIDGEIKRLSKRVKELRVQKKQSESRLKDYMVQKGLEEYEGITLKKLTPKKRPKRKPKKVAEKDAISALEGAGVDGAADLWKVLQKVGIKEEED